MADFADELCGDRLRLRRWSLEFEDELLETIATSFEELHLWMSWAAKPPTHASVREMIVRANAEFDANQKWNYGLFEVASGRCVGSSGLRRGDVPDELEIGYWVRTDRTGRGYASQAASILTSAAFDAPLGIARVRISMDETNVASANVPRKLGFHFEGALRREAKTPGQSVHGALWTVTREKWCDVA